MFERLKPRLKPPLAPDPIAVAAPRPDVEPMVVEPPASARPADAADVVEAVYAEAVRLATEACERALRDTVRRSPHAIRSFVRDAMIAAGYPSDARVCVAPADLPDVLHCALHAVADNALERGSVTLLGGEGLVYATPRERAALLVLGAAAQR